MKTMNLLPPDNTQRWVPRRKVQVLAAIRHGHITIEDACSRYRLSGEELESWFTLLNKHGVSGLRATRVQEYRPAEMRQLEV